MDQLIKAFVFTTHKEGRLVRMTIGRTPGTRLDEAREQAKGLRARDKDPHVE